MMPFVQVYFTKVIIGTKANTTTWRIPSILFAACRFQYTLKKLTSPWFFFLGLHHIHALLYRFQDLLLLYSKHSIIEPSAITYHRALSLLELNNHNNSLSSSTTPSTPPLVTMKFLDHSTLNKTDDDVYNSCSDKTHTNTICDELNTTLQHNNNNTHNDSIPCLSHHNDEQIDYDAVVRQWNMNAKSKDHTRIKNRLKNLRNIELDTASQIAKLDYFERHLQLLGDVLLEAQKYNNDARSVVGRNNILNLNLNHPKVTDVATNHLAVFSNIPSEEAISYRALQLLEHQNLKDQNSYTEDCLKEGGGDQC